MQQKPTLYDELPRAAKALVNWSFFTKKGGTYGIYIQVYHVCGERVTVIFRWEESSEMVRMYLGRM
jgi:hypothetical protein